METFFGIAGILIFIIVPVGLWMRGTSQGRGVYCSLLRRLQPRRAKVILGVSLVALVAFYATVIVTSADRNPEVLGRQEDQPAPVGTAVEMEGYRITLIEPLNASWTHNTVSGNTPYYTVGVVVEIACELAATETCPAPLGFELQFADGRYDSGWNSDRYSNLYNNGLGGGETLLLGMTLWEKKTGETVDSALRLVAFTGGSRSATARYSAFFEVR